MSPAEFAAKVKAKYPDYANIPDDELVAKVTAKYPEYKAQITLAEQPAKAPSMLDRAMQAKNLMFPLSNPEVIKAIAPAAGAIGGGIAGIPGGPPGIIGGSALGGAGGEAIRQLMQHSTEDPDAPTSSLGAAGAIGKEAVIDGALSGAGLGAGLKGGSLLAKVARGVASPAGTGAITAGYDIAQGGDPRWALAKGAAVAGGLRGMPSLAAKIAGAGEGVATKALSLEEKIRQGLMRPSAVAQEAPLVAELLPAEVAPMAEKVIPFPKLSDKVTVPGKKVAEAVETAATKLSQKVKALPLPRSYAGKAEALSKLNWPADVIKGLEADEIKAIIRAGETYPPGKGFLAAGVGEKANGRTAFGYSSRSPNERFARNNTPDARVATDSDDMMNLLQQSIDAAMKRKK